MFNSKRFRRLILRAFVPLVLPLLTFLLVLAAFPAQAAPAAPVAAVVNTQTLLFYDGFDSGNTSGWGASVPRAPVANLAVNNAAALIAGTSTACGGGACGLEVTFAGDTAVGYVQDSSPTAETTYYAGFWFDPNNLTMIDGSSHQIFRAAMTGSPVVTFTLGMNGGNYELAAGAQDDSGNWQSTTGITLSDAPHHLAFIWQAASAPGANDGSFQFWLDNVSQMNVSGLDTDTKQVDFVRLGGVAGLDATTTGSIYFDEFVSANAQPATGEMLLVTATDEANLRSVINSAHSGAVVFFPTDLSGQTILLTTGELVISQDLMIDALALDAAIIIDGNATSRIFNITGGNVTLTGLTLTNGRANNENGGAIEHNSGDLIIAYSTIANNNATFAGGGIRHNGGALQILNSTIMSNTAGAFGGGLLVNGGTAVIENSTFAYNAGGGGGAGGIGASAPVTLTNSTIAHTVAGKGIDIGSTAHLRNSIIAYTVAASDCNTIGAGTIATNINNFIEDDTCSPFSSGDPMLGPLQDNGGRTMTMGILPGTPALDAGDNTTCTTTDQRGIARHDGRDQGVVCDIGAYEGGSMQCNTTSMTAPFTHLYPDQSDVQLSFTQNITDYAADCFYVEEILANHPAATGNVAGDNLLTGQYWRIAIYDGDRIYSPPGSTTFTATLAIPHDNLANPKICKYPGSQGGSGWDCFTPTISTTTFLTLTNVTSFSDWAAGGNVGPTAVSLQTFTANPVLPVALTGSGLLILFGFVVWVKRKKQDEC